MLSYICARGLNVHKNRKSKACLDEKMRETVRYDSAKKSRPISTTKKYNANGCMFVNKYNGISIYVKYGARKKPRSLFVRGPRSVNVWACFFLHCHTSQF